jgi:hypothetical protein
MRNLLVGGLHGAEGTSVIVTSCSPAVRLAVRRGSDARDAMVGTDPNTGANLIRDELSLMHSAYRGWVSKMITG